ncbi:MAG TPA: PD-(D/E)XK nuclease family protein, partial [Granulicella sp.]
ARSQAELRARAEFDAFGLRADLRVRPEVAITDVLDLLRRFPHLPGLADTLDRMASAQHQFDLRPRSFSEWTEWMRTWLALAHWGETFLTISSREFQVRERWESALEALATLDFSGETVTLPEALATLSRITSATVFAPEARNAPVQILGPREAAGSRFDAVWVLRAGELQWPPSTSPHPLLPWSLQRELAMPGADPAREHATASHLTRRLAASAATVFFSFAGVTLEGGHQRAAAVVRDLSPRVFSLADLLPAEPARTVIDLEFLADPGTLSPLPPREHRGGVRVLELQAACGFRAFAEMRLGSGDLRQRGLGLSAAERGSAVHHALEAFWSSVGSQSELRVMTSEARAALLDRAIERGLRRASSRSHDPWDRAYLEVQHARLKRLLDAWLDLELQRPDFIVKDQETRHKLQLGVLHLDVRIDRTDLVDGRQVVLDYKTGAANPSQWLGDRPDQPQVPLYALLASGAGAGEEAAAPLGGVGFAEVRSGKDMRLRGFSESPGMFRGKTARMDADSFPEQIDRWREVLESLANDFATGDARVRPKQFPATCTHCGQRLLCRVDAAAFEEAVEDDLSDAEDSLDG